MRHAKSSWSEQGQPDFERGLNARGNKDAPEMGKRIYAKGFKPDILIASAAKRTSKTAKLVAQQLHYPADKIVYEMDMYEAEISDMLHIIRSLNDKQNNAILFGHNPTVTGLVGYLSDKLIETLPTSGVALIEFDILTWPQVAQHKGHLVWFDFPKSEI